MGRLRDRMEANLKIGGYSPSTRKIYLLYARQFAAHFMRSPEVMGVDEVRQFLLHLVDDRKASRETIRQARSALRFLYAITLRRAVVVDWIPMPRAKKRLPVVLSGSEVHALLKAVRNPKYRAIGMAMYSAGLRIAEACRLRPEHIDSKRMLIHVQNGKGGVDRYTLLSRRLLKHLRSYWRECRPQNGWLFPGATVGWPVSPESVRRVFYEARAEAGILKPVTPHVLRHSFATHLLECGVDATVIQSLLGHSSMRATQVYVHVRTEHIVRVKSPLDLLDTPQARHLG